MASGCTFLWWNLDSCGLFLCISLSQFPPSVPLLLLFASSLTLIFFLPPSHFFPQSGWCTSSSPPPSVPLDPCFLPAPHPRTLIQIDLKPTALHFSPSALHQEPASFLSSLYFCSMYLSLHRPPLTLSSSFACSPSLVISSAEVKTREPCEMNIFASNPSVGGQIDKETHLTTGKWGK